MYKLYIRQPNTIADAAYRNNEDGFTTSFLFDPANTDYQAYLKWLDEGGVASPPDEVNNAI
jgi:hypothetical protein